MQRCLILVSALAASQFPSIAYTQQGKNLDPAKRSEPREQWRAIYVGGANVGYLHNAVDTIDRDGKQVVINKQTSVISLALPRRIGAVVAPADRRSRITIQSEETVEGDVLAFRHQIHNPQFVATRKEGRVSDGRLRIETETNGRVTTITEDFPNGVKGPAHADQMLLKDPLKANETRVITTFDPRSAKVDTVRFVAGDYENTVLQDGTKKRLLHVSVTHSIAPNHVFHEFMDEAGHSWKTTVPSQDMVIYTTSKENAFKQFRDIETP